MMPEDEDAVILARALDMDFWVLVAGEALGWVLTMSWVLPVLVGSALVGATAGWLCWWIAR